MYTFEEIVWNITNYTTRFASKFWYLLPVFLSTARELPSLIPYTEPSTSRESVSNIYQIWPRIRFQYCLFAWGISVGLRWQRGSSERWCRSHRTRTWSRPSIVVAREHITRAVHRIQGRCRLLRRMESVTTIMPQERYVWHHHGRLAKSLLIFVLGPPIGFPKVWLYLRYGSE